jgi:hypothetical protein
VGDTDAADNVYCRQHLHASRSTHEICSSACS